MQNGAFLKPPSGCGEYIRPRASASISGVCHRIMLEMRAWITIAAIVASIASASGQWLNYPTPGIPRLADGKPNLSAPSPKTADGRPDLSGVWAAECAIYDGNPCFVRS